MRDVEKTIGNIIDKQKICYISSIDEDGFPNTKAMLKPRKRNGIKEVYFSTNTSSLKVKSFRENSKACIYFCDSRFFRGAMLKGIVEVIEDQSIKDMLWETGDTMYYSKGKADPDYCVLKFIVISGRYYNNFKSEDFDV
jgi:Uncharacterized stress protein (general stress protein 26)